MNWYSSKNKYGNRQITDADGNVFDSVKERRRWEELKMLEKSGHISDLQRQVKFVLIPAQREPDSVGARGGIKHGRVIEKECAYIADFVYNEDGEFVVEDAKGYPTPEFRIKKKLMLYIHGVKLRIT